MWLNELTAVYRADVKTRLRYPCALKRHMRAYLYMSSYAEYDRTPPQEAALIFFSSRLLTSSREPFRPITTWKAQYRGVLTLDCPSLGDDIRLLGDWQAKRLIKENVSSGVNLGTSTEPSVLFR